jgi:hypothetical protein
VLSRLLLYRTIPPKSPLQHIIVVSGRRLPKGAFPHAALDADQYHTSFTAPAILHQRVLHQWSLSACILVPSNPTISGDRDSLSTHDMASERRPLLPSPLSGNDDSVVNTATEGLELTALVKIDTGTLLEHRGELIACAFNFLLSGIAMAAVGVNMETPTCLVECTNSPRLCS